MKYQSYLTATLCGLVFTTGVLSLELVAQSRSKAATLYFSQSLREHKVRETVLWDGKTYDVISGTVVNSGSLDAGTLLGILRLAYKKAVLRRNPLFHLAGTDTAIMRETIESLRQSQTILAQKQEDAFKTSLVQNLFPLRHLSAVTGLEEARLTFLQSGSEADALLYEQAFQNALATYEQEVRLFQIQFAHAVPLENTPYVSGRVLISPRGFLETASRLLSQIQDVRRTATRRDLCLTYVLTYCDQSELSLPILPYEPGDEGREVPNALRARVEKVRALRAEVRKPVGNARVNFVLKQSECLPNGWNVEPVFAFRSPPRPNEHSYSPPSFLGDIFLLRSSTYGNVPFFRAFETRGIEYMPSNPIIYYKCIGFDKDIGTLAALRNVRTFVRETPLSKYAKGETKEVLRSLEESIGSEYLTEQSVVAYLTAAHTLVGAPDTPRELEDVLISLSLQIRDASAGTYETALNVAYLSEVHIQVSKEGTPVDIDSDYLFFIRSGFPALYMAHNPSAIGLYESAFAESNVAKDDQPYVLFSSLPEHGHEHETLVRDLKKWYELHTIEQ